MLVQLSRKILKRDKSEFTASNAGGILAVVTDFRVNKTHPSRFEDGILGCERLNKAIWQVLRYPSDKRIRPSFREKNIPSNRWDHRKVDGHFIDDASDSINCH